MSQQFTGPIVAEDWGKVGRQRWLQDLSDLVGRHINNRVSVSAAASVSLNGSAQSTGVGTGSATPKRYGEFHVTARATFNVSGAGPAYLFVYRTASSVPANGSAPNAGDVAVGGGAFAGPAVTASQNIVGALSIYDSGLSKTQQYRYYFAVNGPAGQTISLGADSVLVASEL